jgi:type I restriction enzyme S subunit
MSFPTYAHYKDSGVEWLGEVPAHWDLKPLKHLVDFRSGGTPDKTNREFWDGEVPWASAKDLKTDELFDTIDHITETAVSAGAASLVEPGSILVVVRGMILARLFPVVTARVPMAINQDLKALSVKPHIHPDFMAWMLRGSEAETLRRLDEAGHGTKALRMDAWGAMRLPVPYLSEQVRIVDFLKVETTKLDALITEQRTLIDLLKEKRQAVISHAVTKGLDPRVPMKDSGVEWLGEVPAHWSLGGLTRFIGPVVDYRGRTPTKVDDGVFLVTARNIKGGVIDCSLSEEYVDPESAASLLERGKPEIGDVLFTMEAPLGQAALIDKLPI